jgi:hypothetical protein
MEGVDALRNVRPVETWIISARAGLVAGDEPLRRYDDSFARLGRRELQRRAAALDIPARIRKLATQPRSLTLLLAGNEYFDAARLEEPIEWTGPTVALISPRSVVRCPRHPLFLPVGIGQAEARRFSLPLTLLKGELAKRLLLSLAYGVRAETLFDESSSLLARLDGVPNIALAG